MSRKTLAILFVVFAVLCALSVWLNLRTKPITPQGPFPGDNLLAGLDLNRVTAFAVFTAGQTTRVVRKEQGWVVASRYDYPADFKRIVEQLRSLADVKVGQVVRADPSDLAEFGLGPDQATVIQLYDSMGNTQATVRIGNPREGSREGRIVGLPEGLYVQVDTGPVLIVDMPLGVSYGWTDNWMQREALNVPADSIQRVEVKKQDESYVVNVTQPGTYELVGIASNETLEAFTVSRLVRALSPLTIMDIADPSEMTNDLGFVDGVETIYTCKQGEEYRVQVGNQRIQGGGRYVRIRASYQRPPTPEHFDGVEDGSEEFQHKLQEFEKDCAAREQKIQEQNRQFEKWTYVVADYLAGNFTFSRSDLVRIQPPSSTEEPTAEEVPSESAPEGSVETKEASEGQVGEETPPVMSDESVSAGDTETEMPAAKTEEATEPPSPSLQTTPEAEPSSQAAQQSTSDVSEKPKKSTRKKK